MLFAQYYSLFAIDTPLGTDSSLVVPSVNSLIQELPTLTDPLDFCLCLGVPFSECKQILTDNQGSTKSQLTQIAAKWYKLSPKPNWDKVVDALFCHQYNKDAILLAERKGVDWQPLQSKWQKNK